MEGRHPRGRTVPARGSSKGKGPKMVRARDSTCRRSQCVLGAGTGGPAVGDQVSGMERRGHIGTRHFSLQGQEPRVRCRGRQYDHTRPLKGDPGLLGEKGHGVGSGGEVGALRPESAARAFLLVSSLQQCQGAPGHFGGDCQGQRGLASPGIPRSPLPSPWVYNSLHPLPGILPCAFCHVSSCVSFSPFAG